MILSEYLKDLDMEKLRYLTTTDHFYGYREFCREISIPIKSSGSNAQIKQLGELSNICEYEKVQSKYHFIRMRTEDEIKLYKDRTKFTPLIEYCLGQKFLDLIHSNTQYHDKNMLFLSMGSMLIWCGMVHDNFMYLQNSNGYQMYERRRVISKKHAWNLQDLNYFLNSSYNQVLKPIIRTALKTMDNKKSIVIHRGYKLLENTNGFIKYTNILNTSPQGREIERIVANVYTEFKIKNVQSTFFLPREIQNQINDRCNEICQKELGYDGFFNCYALFINEERLTYNLKEVKDALNQNTQNRLMTAKQLDKLTNATKKEFIDTMIDVNTTENFRQDFEDYYKMKMGV